MNINELELINAAKAGDSNSFLQLVDLHSGIYFKEAKKYVTGLTGKFDDIKNEHYYVIWQAVKSFDETKNVKLSTWIGQYTNFNYLISFNKKKRRISEFSVDSNDLVIMSDIQRGQSFFNETKREKEVIENFGLLQNILDQLHDEKIKETVKERYFTGDVKTLKEVGNKLGITGEMVRLRCNKFIDLAREKLKNNDGVDII